MQLDRLNKIQYSFSRLDLSSKPFSFVTSGKAPFPSGFGAFSFCKGASLNRFVLARLREDEKRIVKRMIARLYNLNQQVVEPDVQTWPGKGEPRKVRIRTLAYGEAYTSKNAVSGRFRKAVRVMPE